MPKLNDLTGHRYGRLKVLERESNDDKGRTCWLCLCDCGNEIIVPANYLRSGHTKSCGCLRKETARNNTHVNMIGFKIGRLTVSKEVVSENGHAMWECLCECGNITIAEGYALRSSLKQSCGCLIRDANIKRNYVHGMARTRLYTTWIGIRDRCKNVSSDSYKNYGGRGITIDKEWDLDFLSFYNWAINNGYDDSLTIERIDVNKGYCPSNCMWIPRSKQNRNKTNTIYVTYMGERMPLVDACEKSGTDYNLAVQRYFNGWEDDALFKEPGYRYFRIKKDTALIIEYNGENRYLSDVCREIGFDYKIAKRRMRNAWPKDFLFKPKGFSYKKYLNQQEANAS